MGPCSLPDRLSQGTARAGGSCGHLSGSFPAMEVYLGFERMKLSSFSCAAACRTPGTTQLSQLPRPSPGQAPVGPTLGILAARHLGSHLLARMSQFEPGTSLGALEPWAGQRCSGRHASNKTYAGRQIGRELSVIFKS